jgi:type I restriction enzyme R subunit
VDSYYKLIKKVEDDPEFDTKKAQKKLRRYVESHEHAIRLKAEIMVDHFHEQMVVTSGIERAIQYFHAFKRLPAERKSPYQAIVAFSGEHEYGGKKVSEASLNGFPSKRHRGQDPGRPVPLPDLRRQVPDRLRRAAAAHDVRGQAAVRHQGGADAVAPEPRAPAEARLLRARLPEQQRGITFAFQDYYRTTLLADETDPNKLHDLKAALDAAQVYSPEQVQQLVALFLGGADRDQLDPILDACVASTPAALDEDGRWTSRARPRCSAAPTLPLVGDSRTATPEWEKLSIFLDLLTPKLPAPQEEDLAKGILEAIDMDSYRVEKKAAMKIALADEDAEIEPVPTDGGGHKPSPSWTG